MKLKLLVPEWPATSLWHRFIFPLPPLTLATLAAITPADWEVDIADENLAPVSLDDQPDLVGLTAMTPLAPRAYEIAAAYRARGVRTVMGGFHASALPEEAKRHVDAVVIGEAEDVWPQVLEDAAHGRLQPFYRGVARPDLSGLPPARRDLLAEKGYLFLNTMQTTRGCPFDCEFCSVTAFYGRTIRPRPLPDIERELATMSGYVFFVDDNICGNVPHARALFTLLKNYSIRWVSQSSITLADNPELLRLAAESGCCGLFIGFESLRPEAFAGINKPFGRPARYVDAMKRFHDHGIGIQGSFVFGYDWDGPGTFDEVYEFTEKTRLDSAFFTILTPFPGTRVHERLSAEGRILTHDWGRYDMSHVVYEPRCMSPERLEESFHEINRRFFSIPSLLKRLPLARRAQVFGPMNWGFRRGWKRAVGLRAGTTRAPVVSAALASEEPRA